MLEVTVVPRLGCDDEHEAHSTATATTTTHRRHLMGPLSRTRGGSGGRARVVPCDDDGVMTEPHTWTVDDHLRGADPENVALYRAFVRLVEACGPVEVVVHKTTVTFKGTRRGFAGARPDRSGVVGFLDLMRPVDTDPRITRVTPYTHRLFVNRFRLRSASDLDAAFADWVREAYAVGAGAHLD